MVFDAWVSVLEFLIPFLSLTLFCVLLIIPPCRQRRQDHSL